jgi:uncharacterized membrane protein YphA (DoxX/SURF4 family)
MQRLYPMFPFGLPGLGLFLVRLLGIMGLQACLSTSRSSWLVATVDSVSVALGLGLLTPIACTLSIAINVWMGLTSDLFFQAQITNIMLFCALAMLGPGAYSIDAHIFGRRSIQLKRDPHDQV